MKIFDRCGKINFVDDNNVVLGYDMNQSCCEDFDWFISDTRQNQKIERTLEANQFNLEGFIFDVSFFDEVEDFEGPDEHNNMVIFKITNGKEEKYIHLHNSHNGYYYHGFDLQKDNELIIDGDL